MYPSLRIQLENDCGYQSSPVGCSSLFTDSIVTGLEWWNGMVEWNSRMGCGMVLQGERSYAVFHESEAISFSL